MEQSYPDTDSIKRILNGEKSGDLCLFAKCLFATRHDLFCSSRGPLQVIVVVIIISQVIIIIIMVLSVHVTFSPVNLSLRQRFSPG